MGTSVHDKYFPCGKYALAEWTKRRVKMESPPRLGLGTICIVTFCEGLILSEHMFEFKYGDGKVLRTEPYSTRRLASNPSKSFVIGYSIHIHTLSLS